ncbi:hypothetical protein Bca4012_103546 [Brassica carinata]
MDLTLELSLTFLSSLDYLIIFPPAHTVSPRLQRILPAAGGNNNSRGPNGAHRTDLANDTCLWEPKLLLRVGNRAAGTCVASSPDSDLEAFSHNPAHGSFAPLAFQPSAMTNCANQRFLSHSG